MAIPSERLESPGGEEILLAVGAQQDWSWSGYNVRWRRDAGWRRNPEKLLAWNAKRCKSIS